MTYSFEKKAKEEFLAQVSYYREKNMELSRDFVAKVQNTVGRVLDFPEAWPKIDDKGIRRALVETYPFAVLYKFNKSNQHITIFAIMHTKRKPGYWQNG